MLLENSKVGVIESRSSGMKGTYIKVINDYVFTELDRIKSRTYKIIRIIKGIGRLIPFSYYKRRIQAVGYEGCTAKLRMERVILEDKFF